MINKATLLGHVGRDPEIRNMSNGDAVATVSLATTEKWKDKNGERQEKTEWHRLVFFGKLADIVEKYVHKGSLIYVEGKLTTRKWEKDGVDRYTTEINCNEMKLLNKVDGDNDSRREESRREEPRQRREEPRRESRPAAKRNDDFEDFDDSIPF
jgi:single-strand DNA-binding protein